MGWTRSILLAVLAAMICTCNGTSASSAPRWDCPADWVPNEHGGCGPSVVLCGPDGGAVADACGSTSWDASVVGDVTHFGRSAEGEVTGGWPAPDWNPLAASSCAPGWNRTDDGTCDPAIRTDCPTNAGPLPGGACTQTDRGACPSTPYADVASEAGSSPILYVNATASATGADGSVAHPFTTIAEAIAASTPDSWILLASGMYTGSFELTHSLHIVGRCAGTVNITGTRSTFIVRTAGVSLDLRNVSMTAVPLGVFARNGASASVSHVAILRPIAGGVQTGDEGTHVTLDDVFIDRPRLTPDHQFAEGIHVETGATVEATHVSITGAQQYGIEMLGGNTVVRDSIVSDGAEAGVIPAGIFVPGGRIEIERVVVSGNHGVGVEVEDGDFVARDSIIRGSLPLMDGTGGAGVQVMSGTATLENTLIEENVGQGVTVANDNTTATLHSCAIRNTHVLPDGSLGFAVQASERASVTVDGLLVDGYGVAAVVAITGSSIDLTNVSTRNPAYAEHHTTGFGIAALLGGVMSARHVAVRHSRSAGIFVSTTMSTLDVADALVEDSDPQLDTGTGGPCVVAQRGASLTGDHVVARRCHEEGIKASSSAYLVVSDAIVDDIRPNVYGYGGGVIAYASSTVELNRVAITRVNGAGIAAAQFTSAETAATTLRGGDIFVRGVGESTLRVDPATLQPTGDRVSYGLHTAQTTSLDLTNVVVDDAGYGLFSADGTIRIAHGVLTRSRVHVGARASPASVITLENTAILSNAHDDIVTLSSLPIAASQPDPTSACADEYCL